MKDKSLSYVILGIVAVIAVVGLVTIEPLFRLLGASEKILPLIKESQNDDHAALIALFDNSLNPAQITLPQSAIWPESGIDRALVTRKSTLQVQRKRPHTAGVVFCNLREKTVGIFP